MLARNLLLFLLFPLVLLGGCRDIYVDSSNDTPPFDGSAANPYQRISDATAHARAGHDDNIRVKTGTYTENIELPRGIDIYPWNDDEPAPRIVGSAGSPVIEAGGHNMIRNLIIEGGSQGIKINPSPTLNVLDSAYAYIWNNEIRNSIRAQSGAHGIEVFVDFSTVSGSQLEGDKFVQLFIENNYIHDLDRGDGIRIELRGVDTGSDENTEQGVLLDVKHNVVTASENGISLEAQGVDRIYPAVTISGTVGNNLLVGNTNDGIAMSATDAGRVSPIIQYNTVANNGSNGLSASSTGGNVSASINANIVAGNGGYGYRENTALTTVSSRNHNLFYDNVSGHYFDFDSGNVINTPDGLNQLTLLGGVSVLQEGNLVADPEWVTGVYNWMGRAFDGEPARYFLNQNGTVSPAVDAGDTDDLSSRDLYGRTTSIDGIANDLPLRVDTGTADIGFHYSTAR